MQLSIWDTAGQEKFDSLTKLYFKDAEAALIVYDVTNKQSFEKTRKWVKDLEEYQQGTSIQVVKLLVGNKTDMADQIRVSTQEGAEYA